MTKERLIQWLRAKAEQSSRVSSKVSGEDETAEIYTQCADLIEKLDHDLILALSRDNYD